MLMVVALVSAIDFVRADVWSWGVARMGGADVAVLSSTNAQGAAVLRDTDLAGEAVDEIAFTHAQEGADALAIGGIVLADRSLRFTASVPLLSDGSNSMFRLSGSSGDWTLDGLELRGADETTVGPPFGGAVDCEGGRLTLVGSTFTNLVADQVGGAVCACRMVGDVTVTNCVFVGNAVSPYNGYGGAVYATTVADSPARLVIRDSVFDGNAAEDGGAVCTRTRLFDDERPIAAEIGDGALFVGNMAEFEGGAVLAEGDIVIFGSNTVFSANAVGNDGGAVCVNGSGGDFTPVKVSISNGVTFADNVVTSQFDFVTGGALAVMVPGSELAVERVVFSNNWAFSECGECPSFGGAIYAESGCTNLIRKTAFVGNGVGSAAYGVGGAVSVCGGETTVDNCVFDCRGTTATNCYGSAVDFDGARGLVRNTTIRYGATEGISALDATLVLVNCVAVGNALATEEGGDFLFEGTTSVDMSYTAYGTLVGTTATVSEAFNLTNRVAEAVYDGETLRLGTNGFNVVAALGLVQEADDFVGIAYGSLPIGYSMGAYETPACLEPFVVNVSATKPYDGSTSSNGCTWTWALTDTNGAPYVCNDLVPTNLDVRAASDFLADMFAVTNWTFGSEENAGLPGHYASTNEPGGAFWIDAGVETLDERMIRLAAFMDFCHTGEIRESWFVLPVDCGDGETNDVYFAWDWLADAVQRGPTNDYAETCEILCEAETNGYPRWQNYVMGIDGSNPTNRIATTFERLDPTDVMITNTTIRVVTPIDAFDPPSHGTGLKPEYRLYNMTLLPRGVLPAEKWLLGTADEPRFPLDLPTLTYGLMTQTWDYGQTHLEIWAIFVEGTKPCDPSRLVTNDFGVKMLTGE